MCDPVSIGIGSALGATSTAGAAAVGAGVLAGTAVVGSKLLTPNMPSAPRQPNAEQERAKAEATAAQTANAKLASDQRRRREQASLLSKGADSPSPTFGDPASTTDGGTGTGPLSGRTSRSTVAKQSSSLMARGAPMVYGGTSRGGFIQ